MIRLVEIKVCNDTDTTGQMKKAETQHSTLVNMLKTHHGASRVMLTPLMFGSKGTIYESTVSSLIGLGVPRQAAIRTLTKAHTAICKHLHSIVGARRAMEGTLSGGRQAGGST